MWTTLWYNKASHYAANNTIFSSSKLKLYVMDSRMCWLTRIIQYVTTWTTLWYIRPPIMQPISPPVMSGHSTIVCYTLNSTASNIYAQVSQVAQQISNIKSSYLKFKLNHCVLHTQLDCIKYLCTSFTTHILHFIANINSPFTI